MPRNFRNDPRYKHLDAEQVRQHYEVEKELRAHILKSLPAERTDTFIWAYDELFRRIPWHPALTETSGSTAYDLIEARVHKISRFLPEGTRSILEIGCGMGELMIGMANAGYDCIGVDISTTRIERLQNETRPNLKFVHTEGTHLPFDEETFDVVISMQLSEHLHPDDTLLHLKQVHRVLRPGGSYLLETPNRLIGPSDVSRFFVEQPEGFHLSEYSIIDMLTRFKAAGYDSVSIVTWYRRQFGGAQAALLERLWSLALKVWRRKHSLGFHNPLYIGRK